MAVHCAGAVRAGKTRRHPVRGLLVDPVLRRRVLRAHGRVSVDVAVLCELRDSRTHVHAVPRHHVLVLREGDSRPRPRVPDADAGVLPRALRHRQRAIHDPEVPLRDAHHRGRRGHHHADERSGEPGRLHGADGAPLRAEHRRGLAVREAAEGPRRLTGDGWGDRPGGRDARNGRNFVTGLVPARWNRVFYVPDVPDR